MAGDRYGERVSAEVTPIGRVSAFVRWVARTPWPVFGLGMVQADIIGALLVLGFLRYGLPPEDRIQLQELPAFNLAVFLAYLFVSFTIAAYITLRMLAPTREVDEVAFALPFTFAPEDYVQILTDSATRLGPALGWAPATGTAP